ncbi:MAG TPA: prepilin peptidase [Humisphaera sp.]|nr:prepilin peptidase [Humisphaera sp.]
MSPALQYTLPVFIFALGACVGSFLNVVVWRLPRKESLITPPSHCPKCNKLLKIYDNLPVIGWLMLGGRCRFCREKISPRYPIVEAITGLLFLGYYFAFFVWNMGPCQAIVLHGDHAVAFRPALDITRDWPIYAMDMVLISGLLAASLIDAELFMIPASIPLLLTAVAIVVHTINDQPYTSGGLIAAPMPAALALGATIGLAISALLLHLGFLPMSFSEGEPLLEVDRAKLEKEKQERQREREKNEKRSKSKQSLEPEEDDPDMRVWTPAEIRREIRKEILFLLPPLGLGFLFAVMVWRVPAVASAWNRAMQYRWLAAMLGSILGGLVGGFTVWLTRILGSIGFGREAMGLGDVDLMVAVGAALGAGASVVAFFLAPAFGLAIALYLLLTGTRREIPYGPYLSLGSAAAILYYCDIAAYMAPGLHVIMQMLRNSLGNW